MVKKSKQTLSILIFEPEIPFCFTLYEKSSIYEKQPCNVIKSVDTPLNTTLFFLNQNNHLKFLRIKENTKSDISHVVQLYKND